MSLLLFHLNASRTMNMELFHRTLFVYDQQIIYKHRNLFRKFETTIPYTHVSKFFLTEGIIFSDVEIVAPGLKESIKLRYVTKRGARIAKFLIDEKTKAFGGKASAEDLENIDKIEKYIGRLYEIKKNRKISQEELYVRREIFLKKIEKNNRLG